MTINFVKYHLNAKFQISWPIQTEIIEGGGGGRISPPPAIPICKKPSLFRVNLESNFSRGQRVGSNSLNCKIKSVESCEQFFVRPNHFIKASLYSMTRKQASIVT